VDALNDDPVQAHSQVESGAGLTDLTGKQIGRYLIGQRLGSGGVATVYRAYDQVQGQTVALKLLLPGADEKTYLRFRNEAMTAGALRHPHIVRVLQVGTAPGGEIAYIAMELVEGESLSDLLRQHGRLRPEESANLLEPIARALAAAHARGIVHRDVKPGNILLRPASPGAPNSVQIEALEYPVIPLLTDFGIARVLDAPELTSMGRTVGTPAYMAPEQCAGSREIDGRADIYALGAVLYRCITGRLPFTGTTTQILHAHVYEPLTIDDNLYRQLSPQMIEVLQRSLAKRPEDRYATADEMADALALAAGRNPRRGDELSEATATLTMAALPTVAPAAETSSPIVLVPAPGTPKRSAHPLLRTAAASTPPGGTAATPIEMQPVPFDARGAGTGGRRLPPIHEILLTIVGGLIVMAIGVVLGMQTPRLLRTPLPLPAIVAPPATNTPTPPTEQHEAGVGSTPIQSALSLADTPTDTPASPSAPTATSAATVIPAPTATSAAIITEAPSPAPSPTEMPAPTATPTATSTATPTATATATPTSLPSDTPTPDAEATLVACLRQADEKFQQYINELDAERRKALGCPLGPAQIGPAQMTPFERGYMVKLNDAGDLYIVYLREGRWERLPLLEESQLPLDIPFPPDGLYLPTGPFAPLWAAEGRWARLGYAVEPTPVDFTAVIQMFEGAVLIGNRDATEVAVLPVSGE